MGTFVPKSNLQTGLDSTFDILVQKLVYLSVFLDVNSWQHTFLCFVMPRNRQTLVPIFLNSCKAILSSFFIHWKSIIEKYDILKIGLKFWCSLLDSIICRSFAFCLN